MLRKAILLVPLALAACGGDSGSNVTAATINLTASGAASPANTSAITVPSGGRVHFFNKDTTNHQVSSNCTELSSPQLAPGNDFLSPALAGPKSCTFNDALNPSNNAFSGSVTVSAPGTGGGGGGSGY